MCHWLPQTPELQWPVLQGLEEDLLEMPGGLHLGLEEEEVGVGLQGNKSHDHGVKAPVIKQIVNQGLLPLQSNNKWRIALEYL